MATFTELAKASIGESKNVVVSKTDEGKVSIAQQLEFKGTSGRPINMFVKNAIILDDPQQIQDLIDMLEEAKEKL